MASSIFGRISQLVRANVNEMIDRAEDPEKMIDQLIRDFTSNIQDAEQAVAQTVGNLRLLEDDNREAVESSAEWGNKAVAASKKADEMKAAGKTVEATKFDDLAKVALRRQINFEEQTKTYESQISQQTEVVEKLKDGLNKLREKHQDLVQKRDELVSRAKMARAQRQVQEAVKDVSVMDPTSELSRFEDKIRREEAIARGMEEVASSSIEEQFDQLESSEDDAEVEARLAALKSGANAMSGVAVLIIIAALLLIVLAFAIVQSVVGLLLAIVVALIAGIIGERVTGRHAGGALATLLCGLAGAVVGIAIAEVFDLPKLIHIGGLPVIWTIVGAIIVVAVWTQLQRTGDDDKRLDT